MKTLLERLSNPRSRLVRCYDNGGMDNGGSIDRYTVAYLAPDWNCGRKYFGHVAMNHEPFHPQGFGQHGETYAAPVDFPCARMGRKNHLGKRIPFTELPKDCQKLVLQDLKP